MAVDPNEKTHSLTHMGNTSFDEVTQKNQVEMLTVNPATGQAERMTTIDAAQTKVEAASSTVTYIGKNSSLSAATSDTTWIISKIDTSTLAADIKKTTGSWDNRASLF